MSTHEEDMIDIVAVAIMQERGWETATGSLFNSYCIETVRDATTAIRALREADLLKEETDESDTG